MQTSKAKKIFTLLRELWQHLSKHRRWQLGLLLGMMIVSAFTEVISLGAVLPFIGVLVSPEKVFRFPVVSEMAATFGIHSANELIIPLVFAFAFAALLAGIMRLLVLWTSTRISFAIGLDLSIDVYRRTLYQSYKVHVSRNSSEVISGTGKASGVVNATLSPVLMLMSSMILLIAVVSALVAVNPLIATLSVFGFGVVYGIITWFCRRQLVKNGERIATNQTQLLKVLQEGLGGIREVLLDGSQPFYCDIYHRADKALRAAQIGNSIISASPRFVMESMGMVLMAVLAYSMSRQPGGISAALPMLGVLALGAQRLIPALQQMYVSWSIIVGNSPSLADALVLLKQPFPPDALSSPPEPLLFHEAISFDAVRFRYYDDGPWVLDRLNLRIPKGSRVGFVGATGSGKSTAIDLLMGLLDPTEGKVLVDGQPISGTRLKAWQRNIAHVPQSVYLTDATLAENVAFGVPFPLIDMNRVREVAWQAQIAEFIEKNSPRGYMTLVGERGIRLSGGQRQRIAIARALYKKATILVFDEATSALDTLTEQAVMSAIENLGRDLTIFIIAHRLSTVQHCDRIVELEGGRLIREGKYHELLHESDNFRAMAT